MVLEWWYSICKKSHAWLGMQFYKWGCLVYNRPKLVASLSLIIILALCSGFLKFNKYSQVERIFYPQNSRAFKNLDRADKYFDYYLQNEDILLSYKDRNKSVLTKQIFEQALQMNNDILHLAGFTEFCVKNRKGNCTVVSPLELFQYNSNNFVNIKSTLMSSLANHTLVMENKHTPQANFPIIFGAFHINKTMKTMTASILRLTYPIYFAKTRHSYERICAWELKLLNYLRKMQELLNKQGMQLVFNVVRSRDDSIEQNTKDNFLLINGSIVAMVLFCAIAMTRIGSKVKGHFLVSLFGILCVTLGIGGGFGLSLLAGQPYVGFVGVLPFLVLGIGIDDMFIIINKLDHIRSAQIKGAERLGLTLKEVGISVTMTTVTDLVAFVIGCVSMFPAIRIFCIYAFFSILFTYWMIMTLFLAILTYDMKRVENNRLDCFPCMTARLDEHEGNEELLKSKDDRSYSEIVMTKYGTLLMHPIAKASVTIFAVAMVAIGCYGTSQTNLSFDYKIVGADDTEHVTWITAMETYFPFGNFPIDIVLDDKDIDFTDAGVRNAFKGLDDIAKENDHFLSRTKNWYTAFLRWKSRSGFNTTGDFNKDILTFLSYLPDFHNDVIFGPNMNIIAARVKLFTKFDLTWSFRKNAMDSLRNDLKEKFSYDFYPVTFAYIYATHLEVIVSSTLTNVGICCGVILLITLPYVIKPFVSFLLLGTFLCFILELLGVMYFWGLSLNSITMIVMVMAIGFTVDYSCHITHAYLTSTAKTAEKRVIDAMGFMGLSVLKGGLSTLVGVLVLSLSTSKLFNLFFKMMFSIIILGLIHGMIILPVILSLFCRGEGFKLADNESTKSNSKEQTNGSLLHNTTKKEQASHTNSNGDTTVLLDKIASV